MTEDRAQSIREAWHSDLVRTDAFADPSTPAPLIPNPDEEMTHNES